MALPVDTYKDPAAQLERKHEAERSCRVCEFQLRGGYMPTLQAPRARTSMNFLTPAEVEELTDYKRPSDQIRWLRAHNWKFEIGASGKPKVLREALNKLNPAPQASRQANMPRLQLVR